MCNLLVWFKVSLGVAVMWGTVEIQASHVLEVCQKQYLLAKQVRPVSKARLWAIYATCMKFIQLLVVVGFRAQIVLFLSWFCVW